MIRNLIDVVRAVESSNDQYAIRFESAMFASTPEWALRQLDRILKANPYISKTTAQAIACTSYGHYQLLGAVLYSLNYAKPIMSFGDDLEAQKDTFTAYIGIGMFYPMEDTAHWNEERFESFARYYNGAAAPDTYVEAMRSVPLVVPPGPDF